jgi:hypothetical protein
MNAGTVEVVVNGRTAKWYRSRGYEIPTQEVQLYATIGGKRVKNGRERRVARGTRIVVRTSDLLPASNATIAFTCESCGDVFSTEWRAMRKKRSGNCVACQARLSSWKGGCHSYWVSALIEQNPDARCDISGERDKRFLVIHHLLSRSLGGLDTRDNYVCLSANIHMAFHNWMGGSNIPCRPEDYAKFRSLEIAGMKPTRRQTDILATDWETVT